MSGEDKQLDLFTIGAEARARARERERERGCSRGGPEVQAADLPDAAARCSVREQLEETLFVEAAAGTGKTTELVRRIIAVLRSGRTTLGRMVALTFTDKAAGELKLRLREEIERERTALSPGRDARVLARMDRALGELEAAQIGTIHSFCAELLRERPVEAGVDPLFETAAEETSGRLLDEAFDRWFEQILADPPPGVRRLLRRPAQGFQASSPRELLRLAVGRLAQHRDFPAPWRREPFDRAAAMDSIMDGLSELGQLAPLASEPDDWLARSFDEIRVMVHEQQILDEASGRRDHDGLEQRLRQFSRARLWGWKGRHWLETYAPGISRSETLERRGAVQQELQAFIERADPDLAACLHAELMPVLERYEEAKEREGALDFLDLLLRARDLVRDDPALRAELQGRFSNFFVDEFQDTDPLQVELLLLLAADDPAQDDWRQVQVVPGKLFLVGDPKQSIYRFRRADVAMYEATKERLVAQGARVVALRASFRSVPSIQQAVNAAFAPVMTGGADHGQASYVPLEPVRDDPEGRPAVVALPVPRPYTVKWGRKAEISNKAVDASYPDAVGAYVDWLLRKSGWTVLERGGAARQVPLEPRHICLLFRRFAAAFVGDVTRPYVRALEARRVPHVVVGGRSFHDREEILALRNALTAIEWPGDELAVYATLKGPLFALTDDQLIAFRAGAGRLHPLAPVEPEALPPGQREVAEALALLRELYPRRNRRPIAATILRLLDGVRAHAGLATWPTGEQALANALQLVDQARRFEAAGATSFRAFVQHLAAAAEGGEAQEAPVVEEGTEGVRMMTVHKAKGLEFPVVILADPTAPLSSRASRHVDPARGLWAESLAGCAPHDLLEQQEAELQRDRQEEVRLVYVAATRARDLLVLPALGDEQPHGWLQVLNPAIYPPVQRQRRPEPAPGCPIDFGPESVLERPAVCELPPHASVAPGLHRPTKGDHKVVWWDPGALELDIEHHYGARQRVLVEAADSGSMGTAGQQDYELWRAARELELQDGAIPTLRADAVTALAQEVGEAAADEQGEPVVGDAGALEAVEICRVETRRPPGELGGRRFGTLVHAVLASAPLSADEATARIYAEVQGRMLGARKEEIAGAARAVADALRHPVMQLARQSSDLRREAPVLLRLSEGHLAEGVVDLAFKEPASSKTAGAWVVVDFKTDQAIDERLAEYRGQVLLYQQAIGRATGKPTRGVLLLV